MKQLSILLILLFVSFNLYSFEAYCTRVIDGDTFVTQDGLHVRLWGIDAPEIGQPYAKLARTELRWIIYHQYLDIIPMGKSYGRIVGLVFLSSGSFNLPCVNAYMVFKGLAVVDKRYNQSYLFEQFQEFAKQNKRGVWKFNDLEYPWDFRKRIRR